MSDLSYGAGLRVLRGVVVFAVALLASTPLAAQDDEFQAIPWSQRGAVIQRVGYTDISIAYSRPVARGRVLFGELVRWGRIWHPGADSATTITLSDDIEIEGHVLTAGSYTLWMIPERDGPWTVIVSSAVNIYHSPYPGEDHDVLRFPVEPTLGAHMETLAFYFPVVEKEMAVLRFHWGEAMIAMDIVTKGEPE